MSSPNRCLGQPDILTIICEELRLSDSYASLAAFAVAKSLICDVALDVLWAKQDSLIPLLRTLSQHRIKRSSDWVLPLRFVIDGPIEPKAWARLKKYASRITELDLHGRCGALSAKAPELSLDDYWEVDIDRHTLAKISSYSEPDPMLPRLKILEWTMPDPDLLPLVLMLYSPSISRFTVRSMHCSWLVQRLPDFCPHITDLGIHGNLVHILSPASTILTDVLGNLHDVESLRLSGIRPDVLATVDRMSSPRSLEFALGSRFVNCDDEALPSLRLEHLSHIRVVLEDSASLERLFATVQRPLEVAAFDIICYEEEEPSGSDTRQRNLELIAHALDPACTQEITYYYDCDTDPNWGPVPARALLQLARYSNLSFLGVDCWFDVTDADLKSLARALPLLEFLVLDTHASTLTREIHDHLARSARATLAVLPAFAHHCPQLRALCIRLQALEVPQLAVDAAEAPRVQHPVRMYFAESPLGDTNAVARFLRRVFVRGCSIASRPLREGMHKQHLDPFWDDNRRATSEWPVGEWLAVRQRLQELDEGAV
ncbi:hypothetical protein K523DRAFT_240937 [Schizophyllum commune Tattone D]|nr:hypothetical protein K523DRAFT_240937 [Schizophyllum commune Tattone D]